MVNELNSLNEHEMWKLVNLPEGVRALLCKWAYRIKTNPTIERFKARLVNKGFKQR